MRARGLVEAGVVALAALVLTSILTYPLAFKLDRVGRLSTDDGRWSIWVVSWVAHALTTNPAGVFDANIFYPHRSTLAYSEANLVAGATGAPVWVLTKNPYATHNVVVLLGFVLSAAGAYALARHFTASPAASAVAGVIFAFCPFIFARTAHIQLLLTYGLPWTMLAFHRLVERQTVARAVMLGLLLWWTALACAYYGVFAALMVGLGTLLFGGTRGLWRRRGYWIAIAGAAAVAVGLTLPFFLPYLTVQRELGFARTLNDARMHSADWGAWLASAAWAHRWWLPALGRFNEVLFPGVLAIGLGGAGAWLAWRGSRAPQPPGTPAWTSPLPRDVIVFYALIAVVAFWSSFGPDGGLYSVLYHAIPVFSFLRGPGRIGILVVLALALFAAVAMHALLHNRRRAGWIAAAVTAAAAAELMTAPLTQLREAPPVPAAHRMLATLPRGPVVELPYFWERHDFPRHAYYMLLSTAHWQPLVNGYSDHIPADFRETVVAISSFPTTESFFIFGRLGVRYVVFHTNFYDERSKIRLAGRMETFAPYLRPLVREGDVWLYEIIDWPN